MLIRLVAALALTAGLCAQSALTTVFAADNGGLIDGAVFFDLTVGAADVAVGALGVNCSSQPGQTVTASVYVVAGQSYVGLEDDPSPWGAPVATSAPFVTAPLDTPTFVPLESSFTLAAGTTYAVAVVAHGWAHGYTNGNGTPFLPGSGTNQTYATPDLTLEAGSAINLPFQPGAPADDPRVANVAIHYALGAGPVFAAYSESYGAGCYDLPVTVYEDFAPGVLDLVGQANTSIESILFTPNGAGGYAISAGTGLWSDHTGNITPGAAPASTPLAIGDDEVVAIDLNVMAPGFFVEEVPGVAGSRDTLYVCSNGFVSVDPMIQPDFTPTVAELLADESRWALAWADFQPDVQGGVHFDYDGATCYVTYHDVPLWGFAGASFNSCQIAFMPGGAVEYRYEVMDVANGPWVVGFSTGGGAADPGILDLDVAAVLGFDTGPGAVLADLYADARPLAGTTINMVADNLPQTALFGAILVSLVQDVPGTDLGFIGMPGCNAHIDPFQNDSLGVFLVNAISKSKVFALPFGFDGAAAFCQAGIYLPGANPQNVVLTNAVKVRIGSL